MNSSILNLILITIAVIFSYYAWDANAIFGWGLLATFCAWLITEFLAHNDTRCEDSFGKGYSLTRLAVYSIAMCVTWISFVHAMGV